MVIEIKQEIINGQVVDIKIYPPQIAPPISWYKGSKRKKPKFSKQNNHKQFWESKVLGVKKESLTG